MSDGQLTLAEVEQILRVETRNWNRHREGEIQIEGLGLVKMELEYENDDDYSGPVYWTFELEDGRLFMKEGTYRSHYGTDFDEWPGLREVRRVAKQVTVYEYHNV